jgi:FAD-dependent halogenase
MKAGLARHPRSRFASLLCTIRRMTPATRDVDVVIIGGGPAGSTAGRLLASWGRSVRIVTRASERAALGESLPPSCAHLFERIGVRRAIDDGPFVRAAGNTVWWGGSAERREPFDGIPGYQVDRDVFDRLLLAEAERAGATVERRAEVRDVASDAVRIDAADGARTLHAPWVLDCSGRSGFLARRSWRRADPQSRTMAVVGVWERANGWSDLITDHTHTLVESYAGGWAWSVPVSATRRFFTVMVDPSLTELATREALGRVYRDELARTRHLASIAPYGELVSGPWARDASAYDATRFGERGMLLVGDAGSFVDPLSSFGVKKACVSAWLAAIVVHTALRDESLTTAALELFAARERAMYDSLRARFLDLSREAASAYASDFWRGRADSDETALRLEPDVAALRRDPEVLVAFEELRRRDSVTLRLAAPVRRVPRPIVRGNFVALDDHLVTPTFPEGIRYLRNIDLVRLVDLAPLCDQVPDLYDRYARSTDGPQPPLGDFLGALAVLIGKGILTF